MLQLHCAGARIGASGVVRSACLWLTLHLGLVPMLLLPVRPTAPQTRTARHKIAKFLRQHAALAVYKGMPPPSSTSSLQQGAGAAGADSDARQVRPGAAAGGCRAEVYGACTGDLVQRPLLRTALLTHCSTIHPERKRHLPPLLGPQSHPEWAAQPSHHSLAYPPAHPPNLTHLPRSSHGWSSTAATGRACWRRWQM